MSEKMEFKKSIIILIMAVFLVSIASVCAADANDTTIVSEDDGIELTANNVISKDNLKTSEDNAVLVQTNDDETVSAESDSQTLAADEGNYSDLRQDIENGGYLTKSYYKYQNNDGGTIEITTPMTINGNGAVIDMTGSNIRAFYVGVSGVTFKNLTIKNVNFRGNGGAIYFSQSGSVTNCNFVNNSATGEDSCGGAIMMYSGTVTNCNFVNNSASTHGGAVFFYGEGNVTNCNFTNNTATYQGGAILSWNWYTAADTCIFKRNSGENFNVVIYPPTLNVDNFTTFYGSDEKLTFDLKTNSSIPVTNGNISISVYFKDNNSWVRNYSCLSGEGWIPDLPVGSYYAIFDTEYAGFQAINRTITITIPNVRYYINVTSITTNNKTVNITAKSDIPKDILWDGKLLFIVSNTGSITANYAGNGVWWALHAFDDYAAYNVAASYIGLDNVSVSNATITINKAKTELAAKAVTVTYNSNKKMVITLTDINGKPLSGLKLTVKIKSDKTYTTDANGQVKINVANLVPNTYTVKITFNGDANYDMSSKDVNVAVTKATPKLTAAKKTFKKSVKTKKYTVTLKDNNGKAMKKVKLTLKVKGKTYKAKTNAKGKATFKIKNLKKKGKYKATVRFKGNTYYNKVTKKVKITVK